MATMHNVGIHCVDLGHVALPTTLYLQRFLVVLIEVRHVLAVTLLSTSPAQESGFTIVIFKIKVASDFFMA